MRRRQLYPCCLIYLYFDIYGWLQINSLADQLNLWEQYSSVGWSVIKKKKPDTLENGPTCLDWLHRSYVEADTMKALETQNYTIASWWWTVKRVLKRKSQRRKEQRQLCTVHRWDKVRCNIAVCDKLYGLPPIKINQFHEHEENWRSRIRCLTQGEYANSTAEPESNPRPSYYEATLLQ